MRAFYLIMITFVFFLIVVLNVKFFKFEPLNGVLFKMTLNPNNNSINGFLSNSSLNFLGIKPFNWRLVQKAPKNVTIFCFVKTHPGNFKSRLPKSYNNCISHCTDYRFESNTILIIFLNFNQKIYIFSKICNSF